MNTRRKYLPYQALVCGMVLARPLVLTERGRVTLRLPVGHILNENSLTQLAKHRAEYACVEEEDARTELEQQADRLQQEKRLAEIFKFANLEAPGIRVFYNALLNYRNN